ncbi:SirB1 family protein [Sphingomonas radiodurans]|uniref:SirB1 family protein n=1 Tax=Sphingomonas radiodurans TaxID=2890321 RepID=UPI001E4EB7AB|nr:transglutaminase-like domain-containing protein [Sphingomonas radiodurans]WBH15697.1 transglutaminase-like domain-containing protein [Sphingomonas radiodurans]
MEDAIAHLGLVDDEEILLDADALKLAKLDHPDVSLAPYVDLLTDVTERLVIVGGDAESAADRAAVLAQVLGGEFDFHGDTRTYDDARNADLISVLDRRRGLPVSLAILYVAAARRLSWSADVLNTPGHVLLRLGSAVEPVLVDAFAGGRIVEAPQLNELLERMLGRGASATSEHLAAMTNRAVLVRLLMNQATRAEAAGELDRTLTLYRRITTIAPSHSHGWWERARLELLRGDVRGARSSLSAMLEMTREPGLRTRIFAALEALSHRL